MARLAFGASSDEQGTLLYDPCSGQVHSVTALGLQGRVELDTLSSVHVISSQEEPTDRDLPISLCWSPIVHCNLACSYCLDNKTVHEQRSSERRRIAELLGNSGVLGVDISGGEPLLLPDLPALAKLLREGGLAVSVTTNGWFLQERAAQLVGSVDAIRVSLDGADSVSHDRWRGDGSFERAIAGLRTARDLGIPLQLQFVLLRSTVDQLQGVATLAADLGLVGISLLQALPIGEATSIDRSELLSDEEALRLRENLNVPAGLQIRLRTRRDAGRFTVVRADGWVWRNDDGAMAISRKWPLVRRSDLSYRQDRPINAPTL